MVGEVLDVMKGWPKKGMTMVVVTHEMGFAGKWRTGCCSWRAASCWWTRSPADFFDNPLPPLRQFLSQVL